MLNGLSYPTSFVIAVTEGSRGLFSCYFARELLLYQQISWLSISRLFCVSTDPEFSATHVRLDHIPILFRSPFVGSMATTTSPPPDERTSKRLKQDGGTPQGAPPSQRFPPYRGPPPPQGYYGGPPPPYPPGPPPTHWQQGPYRPDWNRSPKRSKQLKDTGGDPYFPGGMPYGYNGPPPPYYQSQGTWTGKTPPRHPEYMQSYSVSRGGPGSVEDDGGGSSAGSGKEKGRGSYKCGRVRSR